jgi:uncharacterized membrane protein
MVSSIQVVGLLGFVALIAYVIKNLQFSELLANKRLQHLVFGATASIFVLWLFRAGIYDGLNVHFLWLPALSLTLGLRWAIISGAIALLGITVVGLEQWEMIGVNGLFGIALPVGISYAILMLTFHKLPRHLFVYIFVCAFFPGAIAIALKMAMLTGYYVIDDVYSWRVAYDNYLILTPLMLFPEAMLNGMTMTLLTIYKPEWIYTFQDKFYFDK